MFSIMVSIIHAVGYQKQLVYNIALEIISWFFQHEENFWNVGHQSKHLQLLDWHFLVYPCIWLHLVAYQQSSFIFPSYSTVLPPPSKYQPALFVFQNLMLQSFFVLDSWNVCLVISLWNQTLLSAFRWTREWDFAAMLWKPPLQYDILDLPQVCFVLLTAWL